MAIGNSMYNEQCTLGSLLPASNASYAYGLPPPSLDYAPLCSYLLHDPRLIIIVFLHSLARRGWQRQGLHDTMVSN